ncbi:hypothetical protein IGM_01930 [Bacillus cereus HuB4-4]|uniref:YxeA family protein n=1 Tax=Bacillus cereus HuB4-4 TaxID=1053211 RepID=A0A9W5QWS6_BACCE|nr:YxeA family protein [Bacillus cereus]EOP91870.1 hypothetical protein IGM_01930 [Bacillus cereus HuB4-4]
MKKILVFILLAVVAFTIFITKGGPMVDRFNPTLEVKKYYTVVEKAGEKHGDSYEFEFVSYDEDGKQQKIILSASKQLKKGAYLLVEAKGTNGKNWREVQFDEIPEQVKGKIITK